VGFGLINSDIGGLEMIVILLTHEHLLDQMKEYFKIDFSLKIIETANIQYVLNINDANINIPNVIVIPATQYNVETLVKSSYDALFMRVIVDDFTSMVGLDSFWQILASSTIFVNGSKFNLEYKLTPASYYTLKFMPVLEKIFEKIKNFITII
jgi:hypothetical protein